MHSNEQSVHEDGPFLVVAEAGSASTVWAAARRARPNDVTVIAQHPSEEPEEFTRRAAERITRFCAAQWRPQATALGLAAISPDGSLAARVVLARLLLSSMRDAAGGELLLVGDPECPKQARDTILALAQTLTEGMRGMAISVRADFTGHALLAKVTRPLAYAAPSATLRRMRAA